MQARQLVRAVRILVVPVALAFALVAATSAASARPGERMYVLAIGDSMTAGTQPIAPATVPLGSPATEVNRSGNGYAEQLVASLREQGMKVSLVNLACNHETTGMFIDGAGSLCTYPRKSQLAEAVQFLHAHADNTLAVVMSLGMPDVFFSCPLFDSGCYAERFAAAATNLSSILGALRDEGGDVPIATLNYGDPLLAAWVSPDLGGPAVAQASVPLLMQPLRRFVEAVYTPFDVVVVDTQAGLQTDDFADMTTIPVFGTVPVNVAAICTYTWMCTWGDVHPTTTGYGLIAQAFEQALGL